jgi:hypothetical protein
LLLYVKAAVLGKGIFLLQSQEQLATAQSNHALLLGLFVNVDPNPEIAVIRPNTIFSGANIHIISASGRTDENGNLTGLGNLILGYDEDPGNSLTGDSTFFNLDNIKLSNLRSLLLPSDRSGSHNLVIGAGNRFTRAASASALSP